MNIERINFADLFKRFSVTISEEIQREFEWNPEHIYEFVQSGLIDASKVYMKNKDLCDCLSNMGTLTFFKETEHTQTNYFVDNGASRLISNICAAAAMRNVIMKMTGAYDDKASDLILLNKILESVRNNFHPHPSVKPMIDKIVGKEPVSVEDKKALKSPIMSAYNMINLSFAMLAEENVAEFANLCDFFINYFSFSIEKFEYSPIDVRLRKYNLMNNVSCPQQDLHRALSTMSQDACAIGVEDFISNVVLAKKKIKRYFPNRKCKNENDNPILKEYIRTKFFCEVGPTSSCETEKLISMLFNFIANYNDEDRKNFYEHAFDDVELFCNLKKGQIGFNMGGSKKNNVKMFLVSTISNYFSAKSARAYYEGLYFRFVKDFLVFDENYKVTGTNALFTESKVWDVFRWMYLFRFYSLNLQSSASDERNALFKLVRRGNDIKTDDDIEKYASSIMRKCVQCLNSDDYKNTNFKNIYRYKGKYTEFMCFVLNSNGKTFDEQLKNAAMMFEHRENYDIDHIVMLDRKTDKYKDMDKSEIDAIKNLLANLRPMERSRNRSENILAPRLVEEGAPGFPPEMYGKIFTDDDIQTRQIWLADKIRNINDFIYKFEF